MTYDDRSRELYRWAVSGVTGLVAASALIGTGAVAGRAAQEQQAADAVEAERQAAELAAWQAEQAAYDQQVAPSRPAARPKLRKRPTRTRVTLRYVTGAPGTVSVQSSRPASGSSGSGGGGAAGGGRPSGAGSTTPAPPPPPPAPPPPATSGS